MASCEIGLCFCLIVGTAAAASQVPPVPNARGTWTKDKRSDDPVPLAAVVENLTQKFNQLEARNTANENQISTLNAQVADLQKKLDNKRCPESQADHYNKQANITMKVLVVVSTLCFALLADARPHDRTHNQNGDTKQALRLLAWAESKGGQIVSEVILGKKTVNGRTSFDPIVLTDYHSFLRELNQRIESLKASVSRASAIGKRTVHATMDVVLPPGTEEQNLDFNDILDILGDYTKGFAEIVEPIIAYVQPILESILVKRQVDRDGPRQLLAQILTQLQEMKAMKRQ